MPPPTRTAIATTLAALVVVGCGSPEPAAAPPPSEAPRPVVVVHRTETCGCCGSYEEYLEAHGFEIVQEMHDDLMPIKEGFGVPAGAGSCHTNEIDGYFVEGHMPIEAIDELLRDRPDIDGITLPGMPSGSPGMPGEQTEPFVVSTVVAGELAAEFGTY